jgi:protein-disulfide isomerase
VFKTAVDRALTAKAPPSVEDLDLAMSRGPASAPVTIRWFGDVSSPLHRQALVLLRRIVDARPNDVRVRLLAYPSAERPNARLLHEAAASAAEQGRFWEMHDVLMARSDAADVNVIADYAARLGLDRARFLEGVSSGRAAKAVDRDLAEARTRHVKGTPAFFVNEQRVDGLVDAAALERIVADQLSRPGAGLESQAVR